MGLIRTFSGKHINPTNIKPSDICIEDIAQGLSNACRYNGQCRRFYSVAEHSVHVASLAPERLRLAALLHDATEAYMGDLNTFLKHSDKLEGYRDLEGRLEQTINRVFGIKLTKSEKDLIKAADIVMYSVEKEALFNGELTDEDRHPGNDWASYYCPPHRDILRFYRPEDAKAAFLSAYARLMAVKIDPTYILCSANPIIP